MACNHRELYCMGHCAQCGDEVENIVWNQDEEITSLKQQVEALEAARFAYASEFDGDKESIHENIRKMKQQVEALTKRLQRARLDTVEFIHDEIIDGSETANEARRDVFNYYLKLQLEGKSKQEPASD